ncbi:MAG: metallophosphoesterase family protein, partial [Saccharolobus sp.]
MGIKSLRELQFDWKGKVLILSDIHYPYCDMNQINEIILNEKPSLIILLGDIITKNKKDYITFMNSLAVRRNVIYVRGDDDKLKGDVDIVRLRINNHSFTLLHGHQYFKHNTEYNLAKFLKKINSKIPPLLFCLAFRLFLRTNDSLILGHSHVL